MSRTEDIVSFLKKHVYFRLEFGDDCYLSIEDMEHAINIFENADKYKHFFNRKRPSPRTNFCASKDGKSEHGGGRAGEELMDNNDEWEEDTGGITLHFLNFGPTALHPKPPLMEDEIASKFKVPPPIASLTYQSDEGEGAEQSEEKPGATEPIKLTTDSQDTLTLHTRNSSSMVLRSNVF